MSKFTDAVKRLKKSAAAIVAATLTVGGVSLIGLSQAAATAGAAVTPNEDGVFVQMGFPNDPTGTYTGTYDLGGYGLTVKVQTSNKEDACCAELATVVTPPPTKH